MAKVFVWKTCPNCKGTGKQPHEEYVVNSHYSETYNVHKDCVKCKGTGKIKTDMWIEDKYSLFEWEN